MSDTNKGQSAAAASISIIDVRMWFDESPWRVAAGWTVLAAVLASGFSLDALATQTTTIVLIFLLADPLWGSIWGLMSTPNSLPFVQQSLRHRRVWLPYLRSGSPAARLLGMDGPSILALVYRVALPAILLALIVAWQLHETALWLTLVVVAISTAGWLHQQADSIPISVLHALVAVALPWFLVVLVFAETSNQGVQLLLAGLWTLHEWGAQAQQDEKHKAVGLAGLAASQIGMAVLLIVLQLPLWLIFLALFFLPTWLALYQKQPLDRVRFWWIAAMVTSGLALGQIV